MKALAVTQKWFLKRESDAEDFKKCDIQNVCMTGRKSREKEKVILKKTHKKRKSDRQLRQNRNIRERNNG